MVRPIFLAFLLASALASGLASAQGAQHACSSAQVEHNKDLVRRLADLDQSTPEGLRAVADLLTADYIQHNAKILDYQGREGYLRAVELLTRKRVNPNYPRPVLIIADCEYVSAMLREARPDPEHPGQTYDSFWFDIWRVKDGRLAEHWDGTMKGMDYHFDEVIRERSSPMVEPKGPAFQEGGAGRR